MYIFFTNSTKCSVTIPSSTPHSCRNATLDCDILPPSLCLVSRGMFMHLARVSQFKCIENPHSSKRVCAKTANKKLIIFIEPSTHTTDTTPTSSSLPQSTALASPSYNTTHSLTIATLPSCETSPTLPNECLPSSTHTTDTTHHTYLIKSSPIKFFYQQH